ncbi:hypothetical protein JoomaDRAFT_3401 [Galbibacter orientalis DSM 19592]|uniref:Uncharacterized protein n=1 Tax=Galbibacter orientalis DSM 19592 TaxID=926559 RepID=I3C9Q1_9FLAO|nr:hypothetical protein JoomaDRAFT_3401 [Galbibacter orientalis DSM 19592]
MSEKALATEPVTVAHNVNHSFTENAIKRKKKIVSSEYKI